MILCLNILSGLIRHNVLLISRYSSVFDRFRKKFSQQSSQQNKNMCLKGSYIYDVQKKWPILRPFTPFIRKDEQLIYYIILNNTISKHLTIFITSPSPPLPCGDHKCMVPKSDVKVNKTSINPILNNRDINIIIQIECVKAITENLKKYWIDIM